MKKSKISQINIGGIILMQSKNSHQTTSYGPALLFGTPKGWSDLGIPGV